MSMKPNVVYQSAREAIQCIRSGDRVFVHTAAAAPQLLVDAMVSRSDELRDVEVVHLHTECKATYAEPQHARSFKVVSLFIGSNIRKLTNDDSAPGVDFMPVFLSEVPLLFRRGHLPIDVALVQVSPPDQHGYCSLGVSVDAALAAVETARDVVAVINSNMPRTHGDGNIHLSRFRACVEDSTPLVEIAPEAPDAIQDEIGRQVAALVSDGATLQMGIGAIPNAVLNALGNHRDLGIHTEMFSDGLVDLVAKGVVTGKYKKSHHGLIVSGFVMGTRKTYDFVHDNPGVRMLDIEYVNDVSVIRKQPKMTAINSAIEVDLTGQVCADSIGSFIYSGVGGQMDFIRGASLSEGGMPIIALPSRTGKGLSRIVPTLRTGAGVVTTRANVHWVVTEYGSVNLFGKPLQARAEALIGIAHPDDRESLSKSWRDRRH